MLHVGERGGHADAGEVDAVDEEAHRRIRRTLPLLELADAAQLEVARTRGARRPVEIGHEPEHVLEMLHAGHLAACAQSSTVTLAGSSLQVCDRADPR